MNMLRRIRGIELAVLLIFIATVGVVIVSVEAGYRGRFYPRVTIGGVAVSGQTYEEARDAFEKKVDALGAQGLALTLKGMNGAKSVKIPMSSSGLTADNSVEYFSLGDWEATVRSAYVWGRAGSLPRRFSEQFRLLFGQKDFPLPAGLHDAAVQSLLSREIKGFVQESVPARFAPFGSGVAITKEKIGEVIPEETIMDGLRGQLARADTSVLEFTAATDAPAVTAEKLKPFLSFAQQLARTTRIVFYYQQHRWRVGGYTWVTWLTLKADNTIGVDSGPLENFLSGTVAAAIDDPPVDSRFEMRDGTLTEIVPGKSGNVVDVKKTAQKVEELVVNTQRSYAMNNENLPLALASVSDIANFRAQTGDIEVPIQISQADPKITRKTIDQYHIRDLVGVARTGFKGSSADRIHNIDEGISKLTGMLIPPGAKFSAVNGIGPVTEETGFVKEYVIKDNKSVKELGGGLCQLATTLFRMALNAGLPITDRTNHRYVVSYYGPGLDATIYGPEPDLRFVNDTGNYILLQGRTEGTEVVFELYGTRDGRSAEVSDPVISNVIPAPPTKYTATSDLPAGETKCSETPRKGVTADATSTVRYADGTTRQQEFHSVYQPWQRICLIGTGAQ